jgi:ABC-type glycerol-3-phosphate transport system permease component
MNSFGLSKWRFPGADMDYLLFLFGMFIPGRAVMIALAQRRTEAHLIGGIPGPMLAHVVYDIPPSAS